MEASLQSDPSNPINVQIWRIIGRIYQEFDDDVTAVLALLESFNLDNNNL